MLDRIVALGDIHGDPIALLSALLRLRLINARGEWTASHIDLVAVGDLVDKGPDSRFVLDYFHWIRPQIKSMGGRLHLLDGNHEFFQLEGDVSRLGKGEIANYSDFALHRPKTSSKEEIKTVLRQAILNAISHPESYIAQDLARRNVFLKVGDNLFVHGGIGDWLLDAPENALERLNSTARSRVRLLQGVRQIGLREGIHLQPQRHWLADSARGPLWTRNLVYGWRYPRKKVRTVMDQLRLRRIFVGHTPTDSGAVEKFYGEAVWDIDTGMSSYINGTISAVEISEKGSTATDFIPRQEAAARIYRSLTQHFQKTLRCGFELLNAQ